MVSARVRALAITRLNGEEREEKNMGEKEARRRRKEVSCGPSEGSKLGVGIDALTLPRPRLPLPAV